MSNKKEKSFDERLKSLKVGCIIYGILFGLDIIGGIFTIATGEAKIQDISTLIISTINLILIFLIYKKTAEKNEVGPVLEIAFGILMIIEGGRKRNNGHF